MKKARILPVVSLSAEYLVMGHLLRRNILTYKAPQNTEGYDLICLNTDNKKQARIQVKSRYATDSDKAVPIKEKTFEHFEFLTVVFLNIGNFYRKQNRSSSPTLPEFYTLPRDFVANHHKKFDSGFQKFETKKLNIEHFKNALGFELIAKYLKIPPTTL